MDYVNALLHGSQLFLVPRSKLFLKIDLTHSYSAY